MHWSTRVLLALTLLAGIGPSPALAQRNKLDDHLQRLTKTNSGSNSTKVDVIVKVKPGRDAQVAQKVTRRGGRVKVAHPSVDALSAELRRDEIVSLAADPAIERISIDADVFSYGAGKKSGTTKKTTAKGRSKRDDRDRPKAGGSRKPEATKPTPTEPTKTDLVNVLRLTLGLTTQPVTGAGIGVAIIDSGIQPLADFTGRITAFRDFTKDDSPEGIAVQAYDDYGHGTHIAGLVGSNGSLSDGEFRGIAPGARLIGLKVLDGQGRGTTSDVIAALEYAARNKAALGIDVVNLSLGHPIYEPAATDPLVQAVEKAVRAGLVVVAAAGNYGENPYTGEVGYAGVMSPGNAPSAITVGAVKTKGTVDRGDDRVPDYSSRGPTWYDGFLKPDVVAPGDAIVSNVSKTAWLAKKYPELLTQYGSGTFLRLSGTSMSAGVTTGLVALVIEAQRFGGLKRIADNDPSALKWSFDHWVQAYRSLPAVTANTVKAVLQYTALPLENDGVAYDALTQGAGEVNAEGAMRLAFALDASAPLGTQWVSDFGAPSTTIGTQALSWSQTVYWGGQAVLGPSVVVRELAWDGHVVWGTNTFWSTLQDLEHIVWGTNIQWFPYADEHIVWGTGLPFNVSFLSDEHVVWGTMTDWDQHVVWGTTLLGLNYDYDSQVVWGSNTVSWGNLFTDLEHVVWGTQVTAYGQK